LGQKLESSSQLTPPEKIKELEWTRLLFVNLKAVI
jgi:hypothetical protein